NQSPAGTGSGKSSSSRLMSLRTVPRTAWKTFLLILRSAAIITRANRLAPLLPFTTSHPPQFQRHFHFRDVVCHTFHNAVSVHGTHVDAHLVTLAYPRDVRRNHHRSDLRLPSLSQNLISLFQCI